MSNYYQYKEVEKNRFIPTCFKCRTEDNVELHSGGYWYCKPCFRQTDSDNNGRLSEEETRYKLRSLERQLRNL